MVRERLTPGMQNACEADLGAEMFGVTGNGLERLGGCLKQDAIRDRLVLVGQSGNLLRQREHDMKILDLQQVGLARCQPIACRRALALGTMSVPATAVGDLGQPALATALDMPAQSSRSAGLDCCHDAQLAAIEMTGIGLAVGCAVAAEYIRHLELGARHASALAQPHLRDGELQTLKRAARCGDGAGRDVDVACCSGNVTVTEQHLDNAKVRTLLEQMRCEGVP